MISIAEKPGAKKGICQNDPTLKLNKLEEEEEKEEEEEEKGGGGGESCTKQEVRCDSMQTHKIP